MNRNVEYLRLIEELDNKSENISNLYKKTNRKLIRKHVLTAFTATISVTATLLIVFAILINNVNSFAYACGSVPILKDLAKFVAKSPSLSAAVEHQYVQPIELIKTQDDITAKIEYVIVDQKQVNVFYSLKSERYKALDAIPETFDKNGKLFNCVSSYGSPSEKDKLKCITLDFIDENVPNFMSLELKVNDHGEYVKEIVVAEKKVDDVMDSYDYTCEDPKYVTEFNFDINLDPNYTAQGQILELNREFTVDEQLLTITTIEIYPTHIRVNLKSDDNNTKWLKALNLRVENEQGKKFEKISNGISATGDVDSPMMSSHRLESSFFSRSKELTLYIDDVKWLDKDKSKIKLNLKNKTHDKLPENVELYNIKKYKNGWSVEFLVTSDKPNNMYNSFMNIYHDELGNEHYINHSSNSSNVSDKNGNEILDDNQFSETLYLENYNDDIVYLEPLYTNTFKLVEPIEIKIK